jgi:hypothetical protein
VSTEQTVAIIVFVVAVYLLAIVLAFMFVRKRKQNEQR